MKRNINLIELSRDHHHGLLLGWKIKEGFKRNIPIAEIVNYIIHFSKEALFPHFKEEEDQLIGFLPEDDPYRTRLLEEHTEIRNLIAEVITPDTATKELLQNLAEKIEKHIRFEEREMFPYIEQTLSEQQLEVLGKLITEVHQPYTENYPNEFWAK